MIKRLLSLVALLALAVAAAPALADDYTNSIDVFKKAVESKDFFAKSYGYAVFPNVGRAGFVVGGAHGSGRVYEKGNYIGDSSMTQLSVGWQAGAEGFQQIIFFEDERALREFTKGQFEFSADASATVITAAAGASARTTGGSAGASGGQHDAKTAGKFYKGMATFVVVKGGLMASAAVGGQKFSFTPKGAPKKK